MATTAYTTFIGRDYTARLEAVMAAIRAELPELTDLNYSGIANVLARIFASESDYLALYLDEAYKETSIGHADFKQSILDAAATIDERGLLASGAQGYLTAQKGEDFPGTDVLIPKYTAFTRSDALTYLSTSDIIFTTSQSSVQIPVIQGTLNTLTLTISDFEVSDKTERPSYNLGEWVCANTVVVTHGTSPVTAWTEIESFWRSVSTDRHFILNLVADGPNGTSDIVELVLGDGSKGTNTFPGNMTVTFIRTNGANGNCGENVVVDVPHDFTGVIEVTNPLPLRGGGPAEGIESLRSRIPKASRIQRRGLTLGDYSALIKENVSGVKYCQAADRNTISGFPHLYVVLFVVPQGGGPLPETMRDDILDVCQASGHLGDWVGRYVIRDATEVPVEVTCSIGVATGYQASSVVSRVTSKIQDALCVDNQAINGSLSFDNLFSTVISTIGVKHVTFTTPLTDLQAGIGEILTAGVITINVG